MKALGIALLALASIARVASAQTAATEPRPVLPFIEDDYAKALAEAKKRNVPLFVDAWAPWCHTCLSMKAFVYTDQALAKLAPRFVWLEIDTEKERNAAFVARFPIEAWPTLFFIDPRYEGVLLRRLGSATSAQLIGMAEDAERAFSGRTPGWRATLNRAERLNGQMQSAEAAAAYAEVLREAPADWDGRGRAVESYLFALSSSDQSRRCADVALAEYPALKGTPPALTAAAAGLDCAVALPSSDSDRPRLIRELEKLSRAVLTDPPASAAADDISGVYLSLYSAREDAKDEPGAHAVAQEWGRFLDRAAADAPTPEARAVFDTHRLTVDLALGQPEKAIAMLKQSERDLPSDYNPPARLALAYAAAKRYDDALAASDRALAKVYGPRRITVLRQRADILAKKGDRTAARKALDEAATLAHALPATQRPGRILAAIEKQLSALETK